MINKNFYFVKFKINHIEIMVVNGSDEIPVTTPAVFTLGAAYPNPFNPTTNIRFGLSKDLFVKVNIYDVNGRLVDHVLNQYFNQGYHSISWDASNHSSGVYFVHIETSEGVVSERLVLIK